ncbi:MAG: Fe-S cluster assembly ATPase SufC [Bacilli bacterium]|nr:Fe-S cluster assembly ATPase SufC [Bacilli bacterium]
MLKIEKLNVFAEDKEILKNFNLTINDGEIHAIMGPNGVGKSTICKCLLKDPNYNILSGEIIYNNRNLKDLSTTEISREGIMMISQSPIAIEGVTNAEMLRMAMSERTGEHIDIFKFSKEAKSICEKISLPENFLHREINNGASGGERKKTELLHIWMLKPSFLILDEVDSGLDVDALKIVANSIKEYQETTNCSILLITHNPKLLEIINPKYIHILKDKQIVKTGDISLAKEIENTGFTTILETNEVGIN